MKLEVCANGLQSAVIAMNAGAQRIELCTALELGGLTPSYALLETVKNTITTPVRVLVRPRRGHFTYSPAEIGIILKDIEHIGRIGFEGVVTGALTTKYQLDRNALSEFVDAAGSMGVTFHRAIDYVKDPIQAIEQLIDMGFDTVLSSGQRSSAIVGLDSLIEWQEQLGSRIDIMPGAGIDSGQVEFFKKAGFPWIHASASSEVHIARPSVGPTVEEGIPENIVRHTDPYKLRELISVMQ